MAKITVYAFQGHEPAGEGAQPSKVKATLQKIQALGYTPIQLSAQAIDESALNDEEFYEPDGDSTSQ